MGTCRQRTESQRLLGTILAHSGVEASNGFVL